jgi:hypothetical protein
MNVEELASACAILSKTIERITRCENGIQLQSEFTHMMNESRISYNSENLISDTIRLIIYPRINAIVAMCCDVDGVASARELLLSIQQLRVIYTSAEILWRWGIASFIGQMSTFALREQTTPKSILVNESWFEKFAELFSIRREEGVVIQYINCFVDIMLNDTFVVMRQRNIDRVLLCAFVLQNGRNSVQSRDWLENVRSKSMDGLLLSRLPHFLSGSPSLKDSASRLLTSILISDHGLFSLLREYLEGM